jgi:predicted  nucleic acid-binding Zn-ribbon protein
MSDKAQTVFVKVDDYEKILLKLNVLNDHLVKAREALDKIRDLKADEDREFKDWEAEIKAMEERIDFVTETISKK